jgi:aryl-alcohol dehydrogenase-like predicted oxidoreductase
VAKTNYKHEKRARELAKKQKQEDKARRKAENADRLPFAEGGPLVRMAPFGRTDHESSRLLFGAAALSGASAAEADRAVGQVLEAGINHIDVAASYGKAEELLGPALKGKRDSFFLATKTEKRTKAEALAELENSIRLLGTDHVDLWQMHRLVDEADWETAMGPGGALEAFVEARNRGLVRYLGVTGHGLQTPVMHARSLDAYPFDSVLLPWNWALSRNGLYAGTFGALAARCEREGVALQLIKTACRRPWGEREKTRTTWYEPLEEEEDLSMALAFAFAVEGSFVPTAGDLQLLPRLIAAAAAIESAPDDEEMAELAERTGMEPLFA